MKRMSRQLTSMLVAGALCLTATPATLLATDLAGTDTAIVAQDDGGHIDNIFSYATMDITDGTWRRLGGSDRYKTMELIDKDTFESSEWAVIATGESFPDALCANALAGTLKCPVLLTAKGKLSDETKSEIDRLGVKNVFIIGNTGSVSQDVESKLAENSINVTRIAGGSDQEMSIKVLEACRQAGSPSEAVIIATGTTFADALSIGPWSYASGTPIMLTDGSDTLTEAQVAAIKADKRIKQAIVIGGSAVVSDEVAAQLAPEIVGTRIGGNNRYETSAKVADWSVTNGGLSWRTPVVTTGKNFPDSLAGAALAAKNKSVLLVAENTTDETIVRLRKHSGSVAGGYLLGGKAVTPFENPLYDEARSAQTTDTKKDETKSDTKSDTTSSNSSSSEPEKLYYDDDDPILDEDSFGHDSYTRESF